MTHAKLMSSMKESLLRMLHTQAFVEELAFKLRHVKDGEPMLRTTVGSRTAYVVALDRQLERHRRYK